MSEFLYLYRGGDRQQTAAGMQQQMQRWMAWMKELGDKGHMKNPGHPLERTGKVVSGKAKAVTDGPFAEKDMVGGYTLVEASDLAQAVDLSKGCPILDFGGDVEVRPVMKMNM
jgi:hypothetical protein